MHHADYRARFSGGFALAALTALALIVAVPRAAAAQGNLRAAPTGGRTALMGGAGIALGRDGASPFLNPATITQIEDTGIAFSANFYTAQVTHLSNFHRPGQPNVPDSDLTNRRLDALPSTLCLFITIGPWEGAGAATKGERRRGRRKLAGCIGNLETQRYDAVGVHHTSEVGGIQTNQNTSVTHRWSRFYIGPSYSVYLTDRLALGGSLHGIATSNASTWTVDSLSFGNGRTAAASFATARSALSIDLAAIIGVLYHVTEHNIVGLTVSTPTLHLLSSYHETTTIEQRNDSTAYASLGDQSGSYIAPPPIRAGIGIGSIIGRLRIEADASMSIPLKPFARARARVDTTTVSGGSVTSSSLQTTTEALAQTVVDAAVGFEWFLQPRVSLVGGANTDFSVLAPLPQSPPPDALAERRLHRVAVSFGVGGYGEGTELLVGTELSFGWGKAVAVDSFASPPQFALVDARTYGAMLIIAGRTSIATLQRTLKTLLGGK